MIKIALAAAITLAIAAPAMAQTTATSTQQAIAIAGGSGGGSTPRRQTIETTAAAIAPSFYGANPCSNSVSGGAGFVGFGVSAGGQWTEKECRAQEWYRMLMMSNQPQLAMALACDVNDRIRALAAQIGRPCPQDQPAPVAALPQNQAVAVRTATATLPAYCASAAKRGMASVYGCE